MHQRHWEKVVEEQRVELDRLRADTECLDLIEHRHWAISPQTGGGWVIDGSGYDAMAGDGDVLELARTRGLLGMPSAWR